MELLVVSILHSFGGGSISPQDTSWQVKTLIRHSSDTNYAETMAEKKINWENVEELNQNQRFHLHPTLRLPLIAVLAGGYGLVKGARTEFRATADRFLVENSHRLPTTKGGWYFYHKRKNWVCLKSAVQGGLKSGFKTGLVVSTYFGTEALLDRVRGKIDFLNSLVTTVAFGAAYANYFGLSRFASKKLIRNGVVIGLLSGVVQDIMIKARGGDVWYVDKISSYLGSSSASKTLA